MENDSTGSRSPERRNRLQEALLQTALGLTLLGITVYAHERYGISPLLIAPPLAVVAFGYTLWKDFGRLERIARIAFAYIVAWALLAFGAGIYDLLVAPVHPSYLWHVFFVIGIYVILLKKPKRNGPGAGDDAR